MTTKGAAGFEVDAHRAELMPIILRIMQEHTARTGCEWKGGDAAAAARVLCNLGWLFEQEETCKDAA
jgi:hypothetical protein